MNKVKNFNIINEKNNKYPFVISIPHSGTYIPKDIKRKFIEEIVLPNTDWFLTELYDFLEDMDVTVIENNISRYVIDVNRNSNSINTKDYRKRLVFSKTTQGREIYKRPLSRKDVERRIEVYYKPYHDAMKKLIMDKLKVFNKVYVLDLHSYYVAPDGTKNVILLGNQSGMTSSQKYFDLICDSFEKLNLKIERNTQFCGGYITKYYGTAYKNKVECVQIELPYNQYIEDRYFGEEEITYYNNELFIAMKKKLEEVFKNIVSDK